MKNNKVKDIGLCLSNRTSINLHEFLEEDEDKDGYWSHPEPDNELKKLWNGFIEEKFSPYDEGIGTENNVFVEGFRESFFQDIWDDYVSTEFHDYVELKHPKINLNESLWKNKIVKNEG